MTPWQSADRPRQRVGRGIEVHDSIGSTNDQARGLLDEPDAEGRAVVAEVQTAGRGRRGRTWVSRAGVNLTVSVGFRLRLTAATSSLISLAAALAARDACGSVASIGLKWPNDLVSSSGAKVGGLLIETELEGDLIATAVIGLGINVNWRRVDMPPEIASVATSLADEAGAAVDRAALLARLLDALDDEIVQLEDGRSPLDRYRAACVTLGTDVEVEAGGARVWGRAVDIDAGGALMVQTTDGPVTLTSGEIVAVRAGAPA